MYIVSKQQQKTASNCRLLKRCIQILKTVNRASSGRGGREENPTCYIKHIHNNNSSSSSSGVLERPFPHEP